MEPLGSPVNSCPISEEPTALPCDLHQGAVGLAVERDLADAGHQQRVGEAEHHGEGQQEAETREGLSEADGAFMGVT